MIGRRHDGAAGEPGGPGLPRGLALLVAGAFFMEILDGTVIAPAAPLIAADLGIRAVDVNVAISGYLVTVAVLIPISGWAADRFGTRRVFATAIVLFTLASAGCALAPNLATLTVTRVLQGVGGALMVPVGRLAVLRATAKADLIKAIAYLTWPALLAPVLAPAIGGVLSEYASWRWIFVINVPLGIAGLLLVRRLVPDLRAGDTPPRLDRAGFVLVAVGIAALMVAVENVGEGAIDVPLVAGGAVLAAALLAVAVIHLLRASAPLLDLRILRILSFRVTAAGGSVYRMVIVAIPFLLPLQFQLAFGWNAAQAGLVVIALFAGNVAIKPVTTPLMRRFGLRTVLLGVDPRVGAVPARDRGAHGVDPAAAADRDPGAERGVPVDRLLRLQQPGLRRRRARSHDAGEHADDHAAGARRRAGRRGGRAAAAAGRADRRRAGPGGRCDQPVPRGVRPAGGAVAGAARPGASACHARRAPRSPAGSDAGVVRTPRAAVQTPSCTAGV